jgi:prolyl-tRNA editing enzyme YbaK/EbsC (Cys-tRNA(Pro) deacylase)
MSAESVHAWLQKYAPDLEFIEVQASTATVLEAADALGVEPAQIAKSLAVRAGDRVFLLVTSGIARLDNAKAKSEFGGRPRMLGPEETREITGHPVGGVCPFDLPEGLPVYLDVSLRPLGTVYPAGGSLNTSVRAPVDRLFDLVGDNWVDACRLPEASNR